MQNSNLLTWKDLYKAKFPCITPFQVALANNQIFYGERVVRIAPKRRLVVFGTWQGKPVVAKLFFNPKRSRFHFQKDSKGIKALMKKGVLTPELFHEGISDDGGLYFILVERIFNSQTLYDIWRNKRCVEDLLPMLESVIAELAKQHSTGVLQKDLKLRNFLLNENSIYTIDGAEVELFPMGLSKEVSIKIMSLFFSELGVEIEDYYEVLFHQYAKLRGIVMKKEDVTELLHLIREYDEKRWKRYGGKLFAERSRFFRIRDWGTFGMADRNYAFPEFIQFLNDPEAVLNHPNTVLLKSDLMSKLFKVTLDDREFVVKCYQIQNLWQSMRTTEASTVWQIANKLEYFGIPTPKPIAFIEKKYFGLCSKTYYVTEFIDGENATEYFDRHQSEVEKVENMKEYIDVLLKNINSLKIENSDIKVEDILIDELERPVVLI